MDGVLLRMRAWARTGWRSAALVVLLAGVSAGMVLALAGGARRTASAPDRYTEAAGGDPELALFQPFGPPLDAPIAALPGVREVQAITFVAAFPTGALGSVFDVNPFAGDDRAQGGRVLEGRFTDPAAPDELTMNRPAVDLLGAEVGDRLEFVSYSQPQVDQNQFLPDVELAGPTFDVTVVGIVDYPADLDDPVPNIVFSAAMLDAEPDVGRVATLMSVRTDPRVPASAILDAVRGLPGGEAVFEENGEIVSSGARRAIRLHVFALWVVAGVAAVVAALIAAQLVARQVRAANVDGEPLRALGYDRRQVVVEASLEALVMGFAGSLVAIAVAFAASGAFPIGALRSVEPDVGPTLDVLVTLVGGAGLVVTFVAAAAVTALRMYRPERPSARVRTGLWDIAAAAGAGPSVVTGVRFAFSPQGRGRARPVAVALSVTIGITGLVGSLLVGTSLVRMIDDRAVWGADYDQLFGNPFLPAETDIVTPAADDPDVAGLTAATSGSLTIDGADVPVLAYESIRGGVLPVILDGRVPSGPDEIALGRVVARTLDRSIGDIVTALGADGQQWDLRVVGYVVIPGDGGDGASMTFDAYQSLVPDATRNLLLVRFRDGASTEAVDRVNRISANAPGVDDLPTSVRAFERVVPAPYLLALILVAMTAAALAYHLGSSVRQRTRDLAILRSLGADRHQLRATVHWQASCVAAFGLIIGVPAGIAIGARIHRAIADSVGVVPAVTLPGALVAAVVAGVVVIANMASMAPARRAARLPAATVLQEGATADR